MQENGIKLLHIEAKDSVKFALALMEALFTDVQMAKSCFSETVKSTMPPLPETKTKLIKGVLQCRSIYADLS